MDKRIQIFAFLLLICITKVVADDCAPYVGPDFTPYRGQTCVLSFCAGSCTNRYCSIIPGTMLDQSQFMCILNNLYVVIGAGIVISLIFIAGVITCFCKSLCLCCSLFQPRSRSSPASTSVTVNNAIPHQPMVAIPVAAGYQPVPNHSMYAGQPDKPYLPPPYPGEATAYSSYPTK